MGRLPPRPEAASSKCPAIRRIDIPPKPFNNYQTLLMTIHLWNTNRLAVELAQGRVTTKEKFVYLAFSWTIGAAAGYIGSLFITGSAGWLYWYEGLLVSVITVFGLIRCRDKYEGAGDDRLLEHCVILSAPLNLKYFLYTWLAYVAVHQSLTWVVLKLSFTSEDSSTTFITWLLNAVVTFQSFLITVIGLLVFYLRMSVHLKTIAAVTSRD